MIPYAICFCFYPEPLAVLGGSKGAQAPLPAQSLTRKGGFVERVHLQSQVVANVAYFSNVLLFRVQQIFDVLLVALFWFFPKVLAFPFY
jgi:hypothetical protein